MSLARDARLWLRAHRHGLLATHSLAVAGYPFGSVVPYVLDHDACRKLQRWFDDRWKDKRCLDISKELIQVIDESWVTQETPYHIYLKIAYHLSNEARAGLAEFRIPKDFQNILFPYQAAAVQIAAHHVKKRGGVLIGDVVGLGKTLMATALARLIEEDTGHSTLIICPKNLVKMWESYADNY